MPIGPVVGVGFQVGAWLIVGNLEFGVDVLGLNHQMHKNCWRRAGKLAVGIVDVLSNSPRHSTVSSLCG